MDNQNPKGTLEDIAFQILKLREENYILKSGIQKLLELANEKNISSSAMPFNEPIPEVYINATEVQRLLSVSAPVVTHWVRDGLLITRNAKSVVNNRFLLSEILWLKKQSYRKANAEDIRALIRKKELEYQSN